MWDVILYNGEADMLECRLHEIGDLIECCVLLIGDRTFQNVERDDEALDRGRFGSWWDRLCQWDVELAPSDDPWVLERQLRQATGEALDWMGCPDAAMVLHGDVDEIPNRDVCTWVVDEPHVLWMRTFAFCVDWEDTPTDCGVLAPRHLYDDAADLRARRRSEPMAIIEDAGWHLTWVGSPAERATKLASFSHPEAREWLDPERVAATGEGWLRPLAAVDVDESWPRWVRDGLAPEWWYRPR